MVTTNGPAAQVIAGRYEVVKNLGRGNYGEVHEVFDHHLQQTCALKLMKQKSPFGVWAEAEILNRLYGEHILPIRNADLAQGVPYLVTDLATHGTVADQITPDIGLPIAKAVRWARQSCQGLARIHDHRLLHCDLKPENLFLTDRRDVVVGDLGLSQLQDHNGFAQAAGSLLTLAPEVAWVGVPGQQVTDTKTCSVRSDIYSLGATLFWMLAGSQPVPGVKSQSDVWSASQPDLWDVAPHVSQGLRDIVNTAIARDPGHRFLSAAAFDAALGGRTLPVREWTRTVPHPGHEQCYTGTKGVSRLEVCAVPTGKRTQLSIVVQHAGSGRVVRNAGLTVSRSGLAAGLRSSFRQCS